MRAGSNDNGQSRVGVASLEAAVLEGFNAVGIEREADYLPLIRARLDRATAALDAQAEAEGDTLFPIDGAAS